MKLFLGTIVPKDLMSPRNILLGVTIAPEKSRVYDSWWGGPGSEAWAIKFGTGHN